MKDRLIGWAIILTILAWGVGGIIIIQGLWASEPPLKNPRKIEQIAAGMNSGAITIAQASFDQPLKATFDRRLYPENITDKEWQQLETTIEKLVAASNWGLGSPFKYRTPENSGGRNVIAFNTDEFKYFNPFEKHLTESSPVAITYSNEVAQKRIGWRIIGPSYSLFFKNDAIQDELEVNLDGSAKGGLPLVAKTFLVHSSGSNVLRLSVLPSVKIEAGKPSSLTLGAEILGENKQIMSSRRFQDGQSFIWQGQSFVVREALGTDKPTSPAPSDKTPDDDIVRPSLNNLVLTKRINGRSTRVNLFGQSTMNLIGFQIGGRSGLLDGAIKTEKVSEVRLTLDPDLQYGSFRLIKSALEEIDGKAGIGRQRRGTVAILNAENGAILTLAGYPSVDPNWLERRRVLVDRNGFAQSPAFDKHMPGSAVKVLTVAMGFLLYGSAQADLLPTSNNQKAVRQAFHDAYGKPLAAELVGSEAVLTEAAKEEFKRDGGISNLIPDCPTILEDAFGVLPTVNNRTETQEIQREEIIRGNLKNYFDVKRLDEISPVKSSFPVKNADSMIRFRNYALGGEEARFTMLRLAGILGTAGNGKKYNPYLVESIKDKSGNLIEENQNGATPLSLSTQDGNRNVPKMMSEMPQYLGKVLVPGGTGSFFLDLGNNSFGKHYLRENDPLTSFDERQSREKDYGKSGTASYDGENIKPDSVFVYSHGKYLIAVWLERADFDKGNSDLGSWSDNPAHKTVHRIVQLIENLEYQPKPQV